MTEVFYYAYWNGEALSDVFNATAAVFGTGDFSRITSVVVLASLLCVVAFGAIKNEGRAVIQPLFSFGLSSLSRKLRS